jgi:hypothetical protein
MKLAPAEAAQAVGFAHATVANQHNLQARINGVHGCGKDHQTTLKHQGKYQPCSYLQKHVIVVL